VVADSLARAFAALVNPAAKPGVRFLEIPGRTTATSIPTRHGTRRRRFTTRPNKPPAGRRSI
jgi:hypothetical protein